MLIIKESMMAYDFFELLYLNCYRYPTTRVQVAAIILIFIAVMSYMFQDLIRNFINLILKPLYRLIIKIFDILDYMKSDYVTSVDHRLTVLLRFAEETSCEQSRALIYKRIHGRYAITHRDLMKIEKELITFVEGDSGLGSWEAIVRSFENWVFYYDFEHDPDNIKLKGNGYYEKLMDICHDSLEDYLRTVTFKKDEGYRRRRIPFIDQFIDV